eukprot:TRINITY_DN7388_c1_g1_i1.p1 TRINITY_DN7388_c1_g1~~TRINITY_DN7388_c1_g1_i1.p1  ORF type:complete len:145 (-),score=3.17 TRINITY_DN7388_c1_g1_i1:148-582(-)
MRLGPSILENLVFLMILCWLGFHLHEVKAHNIPVFTCPKTPGAVAKPTSAASLAPFRPFPFRKHTQVYAIRPASSLTVVAIHSSTSLTDRTRWMRLRPFFFPNIRLGFDDPRGFGDSETPRRVLVSVSAGSVRRNGVECHKRCR